MTDTADLVSRDATGAALTYKREAKEWADLASTAADVATSAADSATGSLDTMQTEIANAQAVLTEIADGIQIVQAAQNNVQSLADQAAVNAETASTAAASIGDSTEEAAASAAAADASATISTTKASEAAASAAAAATFNPASYQPLSEKGANNGYAGLDGSGKLASAQVPTTLAPKASPAFTGTPTAPTASPGNNSTQLATTAYADAAVAALVNSSPSTLDTLKELSDALGADPNFATTVTNALAGKEKAWSAWATKTNGQTLADRDQAMVDSSSGSVTVNLPTGGSGKKARVLRTGNNSVVVGRNSANIYNPSGSAVAEDYTIDINHLSVTFEHDGTAWLPT